MTRRSIGFFLTGILMATVVGCGNTDPEEARAFYGAWTYADGTGSGDLGLLVLESEGAGTLHGARISWALGPPIANPLGTSIQTIVVTRDSGPPLRFQQHTGGLMEGKSGAGALWESVPPAKAAARRQRAAFAGRWMTDAPASAVLQFEDFEREARSAAREQGIDDVYATPEFVERWGTPERFREAQIANGAERLARDDHYVRPTLTLSDEGGYTLRLGAENGAPKTVIGTWSVRGSSHLVLRVGGDRDAGVRIEGDTLVLRIWADAGIRTPVDDENPAAIRERASPTPLTRYVLVRASRP